jgi:macrolide transport system ATP-binding/permease protein
MKALRALRERFLGSLRKQHGESDFDQELASHVEMQTEENIRRGMPPAEAHRQAILKLGGLEHTRQAYREQNSLPFLETLQQDVRFAWRQCVKAPGFAITAVVVLSLGIAASATIFAFVDAALIRPLPYHDPNRLAYVTESTSTAPRTQISYLDYLDWKKSNEVFDSLAVWTGNGIIVPSQAGSEIVMGALVSDNFFATLGVTPVLGRDFRPGEDLPGAEPTLILSYQSWQKRFGGRTDIVGQTIHSADVVYTIVGVLPADFQFAPRGNAEIWATLRPPKEGCMPHRGCHNLDGVARLKSGVSLATAHANLSAIADRLAIAYPDTNKGQGVDVEPFPDYIQGTVRPIFLVLLGGAGLLLLIGCVNVSSLLLVRLESRRREVAIRSAIGASRGRLFRQFLTEGAFLVLGATTFALGLSQAGILILAKLPTQDVASSMPYLQGLGLNLHVVIFIAAIALLAICLFALAPIVRLPLAEQIRAELAEGGRAGTGKTWRKFAANLVVVELAIAVVLLSGAALLGKSFYRLLHVNFGFEPEHIAVTDIFFPDPVFPKDTDQIAIVRKVIEKVSSMPGVVSAAVTNSAPASYNGTTNWIRVAGHPYNGEHNEVLLREVGADYLKTTRAQLAEGRWFTDAEDNTKPRVVVINEALAKKYFPGEDPVGKQMGDNTLSKASLVEVIGVVKDIREGPMDDDIWPAVYHPFNQSTESYVTLLVRTSQSESSMLPSLVAAVRSVHPAITTQRQSTIALNIAASPSAFMRRSSATLVGGFAVLALVLGVVGLYGVIAYSVSQRTREIGVRMALGAPRASVYALVLREAVRLTVVGLVSGTIGAIGAAMMLRPLLFQVRAWDIPALAGSALLLGAVSLFASYLPARRAASLNPVGALRAE